MKLSVGVCLIVYSACDNSKSDQEPAGKRVVFVLIRSWNSLESRQSAGGNS